MKKIIAALLLLTVYCAGLYAAEHTYDGTQESVSDGDTLIFNGASPYNNIGNDINFSTGLTGTIFIQGKIDSYQKIFGNNLLISSNGKITVDLTLGAASVLFMASKTVENDGVFTIVGDGSSLTDNVSDISFKGAGEVVLNDSLLNLTNKVLIEQSTLTISAGKLTSNADLLKVNFINNDDTLTLTGGKVISEIAGNGGTLNINASEAEKTVFANSVLGNDINLNFGTLKLGSHEVGSGTFTYGQIGSDSQRNNFTMQDKTVFDMADGNAGDTVYVNDFVVNGSAKINADFDLAGLASDKINISGSFTGGSVDLSGLNIVSDFNSIGFSTDIALFEGAASANIASIDTVYYKYRIEEDVLQVSGSYHIVNSADSLGLNFTLLQYETDPFQAAVKAYGERLIRMESDYNISENFDNIISTGIFTLTGGIDGVSVIGSTENPKSIFILQDTLTTLSARNIVLKNGFIDDMDFGGAAIYNEGNVFLSNSVLEGNAVDITTNTDAFARGGAIYNIALLNVSSTQFKNNFARASAGGDGRSYSRGGAVYLTSFSDAVFDKAVFENNYAQAQHVSYGGAIYIDSDTAKTVNIENTVFRGNYAYATDWSPFGELESYGGAIYNGEGNTLNITNSSFFDNSASIYISGKSQGGAIYNAGILNLFADGGDIEFSGNTAGWKGVTPYNNAVHNSENGEINLYASPTGKIIFNDVIEGDNGTININDGYTGIVEFNNAVRGNDIFLYGGTLKIGASNEGNVNKFTVSSGAVIDMLNARSDTFYAGEFYMPDDEDVVLKIDIDLANSSYDKINISSAAFGTGKFDLSQLKIVNEFTKGYSLDAQILINSSEEEEPFINDYLDTVDFELYRYHNEVSSSVYRIKHNGEYGTLNILITGYAPDAFQAAISTDTAQRSVDVGSNYFAVGGFSSLLGDGELTVNISSDITINANEVSNVFLLSSLSQSLKLNGGKIINGKAELGGAIYNSGEAIINGAEFSKNVAVAASSLTVTSVGGGAIYNNSVITIYDSVFKDNEAQGEDSSGGAILNEGAGSIVNLVARDANLEFSGNKANGVSNAFTAKDGAEYNLNAGAFSIILNDNITSIGDNNVININISTDSFPSDGAIIINADMSGFGNIAGSQNNTVNVYGGSVKIAENAGFFTNVNFVMHSGATLDMANSKIDNIALDGFSFNGDANLIIDADLRNKKTDSLLGSNLAAGSSGHLVIKNIVIWKDAAILSETFYSPFADDEDLFNAIMLSDKAKKAHGPIFIYDVSLSAGNLVFEYANDYNPSIFIAPVTMLTGGYLGQINSYRQAFEAVDDSYDRAGKSGLWVKPYTFSEDIELNGRLKVSNEAYGVYFGYDSKITEIYSYTMNFSIYGAYNTLRQTYEGTEINQGGGMIGVTAIVYADSFFTALTANMGIISEHGQGTTSKDNFMMYTKGMALKGGYNMFFSNDEWQLQPSLSLSMTSLDMAPYENSADVRVSCEKFMPFHIEPAVKLISNAFEGVKLYADLAFIIGLSNATEFHANDVVLPDLSIDPYLQFSLGGYKNITKDFTAGGELFGRSGGRSGLGCQLTLKLKL